ncbi:GDSL-type esterase/lipase family protein [Pajaroellobacter abortibovis]|uniref:GDSL-type esterase/lipase family protein n=1 Tax=Pajaroellobacter abortibovis TaxID=1882918 RepID=UPI001C12BC58|nr:GDSL-type esterase/lipase family protein [Pajaroellobacter abortibovis]
MLCGFILSACQHFIPEAKSPPPPPIKEIDSRLETNAAPLRSGNGLASQNPNMAQDNSDYLEFPHSLDRFFQALATLEGGAAKRDVLITQLGDSHTVADWGTAAFRRYLQSQFGNGGRGFVALGKPMNGYIQQGVRGDMSTGWVTERPKLVQGQWAGDGYYGLNGMAIKTSRKNASAWIDIRVPITSVEIAYFKQPRGGQFDVLIDGKVIGRVSSASSVRGSGFFPMRVQRSSCRVQVRTVGDGEVRIFGATLEHTYIGITVDAVGSNGARVTTPLQSNEDHLMEQLRHRNPELFIVAYGTNEAGDDVPIRTYENRLTELFDRIARSVPKASCLILSPPDRVKKTPEGWVSLPKIRAIMAFQRRVAASRGCAFYSLFNAMGGAGAIRSWATELPPRAQQDGVHLTREGYALLGRRLAFSILRAYGAWRMAHGLPPRSQAPVSVAEWRNLNYKNNEHRELTLLSQ